MPLSPIVLFVYNRHEHTRRTVEALQKNIFADQSELFVFSDGPKNIDDAIDVQKVREYVRTIKGFKKVEVLEKSKNLGLAKSIIDGVTYIVYKFGKIIILEDDLISSKHFLQYMNDALDFYQNEERVVSIHGYTYPVKEILPETFFLKGAGCWGWATWKRGWDLFEPDGKKLLEQLKNKGAVKEFNFGNSYHFYQMLERQVQGKNNSWAIRWNASAFLADKITLYPGKSLIRNIGFDGTGTHSGSSDFYLTNITKDRILVQNIPLLEHTEAKRAFENYFNSLKPNIILRFVKKCNKIFKSIKRQTPIRLSIACKYILSLNRSTKPKSRKFGFDRGGPIDHYYIQKFIKENSQFIHGVVLEVADSKYSKKFGNNIEKFEVLHLTNDNAKATIVADLTEIESLPENFADCFICTQTFNFIYDFKSAIKGAYRLLKPGGVLLATVAGISQISRYDMDRWGDYWRFTTRSCEQAFQEVFGTENVVINFHGNCLVAKSFLNGKSSLEFTKKELDYRDNDYQMLITIRAHKPK